MPGEFLAVARIIHRHCRFRGIKSACEPAVFFSNRMSTVSSVSSVSGVSDKFESKWLTVSRVSGVSGVSAGAVNYSTVDFLLRRNWRA